MSYSHDDCFVLIESSKYGIQLNQRIQLGNYHLWAQRNIQVKRGLLRWYFLLGFDNRSFALYSILSIVWQMIKPVDCNDTCDVRPQHKHKSNKSYLIHLAKENVPSCKISHSNFRCNKMLVHPNHKEKTNCFYYTSGGDQYNFILIILISSSQHWQMTCYLFSLFTTHINQRFCKCASSHCSPLTKNNDVTGWQTKYNIYNKYNI